MNVDLLRQKLQDAYRSKTEGDEAQRSTVPDFREYDGVKLQNSGRFLTAAELSLPVEELADKLAEEAVKWELRLLDEAGRDATPRFLRGHELPNVVQFPVSDRVKFRHIFAAVRPAEVAA